ncbi:RNA polymerase sigma factor [Ruminococcus sp. 5_1_39BFAA]|uniref:RNA polymerase sigma factor n=1 Tax=Ruminococcus sp. 5_1_39BFAA TaxID=457412 RepID=UPI0035653332
MDMEELYNRYFTVVYKYLFSISQDKHIAEELTQETFFKALQKIDGFRGQCSIRVWLCQIGKNAYYDYLRKNRRLVPAEEGTEGTAPGSMELDLEKKETVQRLHRILHNLDEPYKEVFSLRVFGELSFRDISSLFGKSESWAKMTYLRAKKKIQEVMEYEDYM